VSAAVHSGSDGAREWTSPWTNYTLASDADRPAAIVLAAGLFAIIGLFAVVVRWVLRRNKLG
jgi:hypothetical protein